MRKEALIGMATAAALLAGCGEDNHIQDIKLADCEFGSKFPKSGSVTLEVSKTAEKNLLDPTTPVYQALGGPQKGEDITANVYKGVYQMVSIWLDQNKDITVTMAPASKDTSNMTITASCKDTALKFPPDAPSSLY